MKELNPLLPGTCCYQISVWCEMAHFQCFSRGRKSLSSRILEDQFTSPSSSPCPWTTKSLKISKEFAFCKLSIMYDHVIQNCTLNTTHSARNLGFIFNEHLTFSDQISALSKSCYSHIRELRCIRPYLDFNTAS